MRALKYPFTLDKFGVVYTTVDPGQIYLDRLLTLLSTHVGQRPMLQAYGTDFTNALFQNENKFGPAVQTAVSTAISKWMTDVKLISVDVENFDEFGTATLLVVIQIPDGSLLQSTVKTSIFNSDGTITGQA